MDDVSFAQEDFPIGEERREKREERREIENL